MDQLRVSKAGIDNTVEAIMMAAIAGVMVLLFALAATGSIPALGVFNNALFLLLTLIALTAAVVAILINARSLRRSIDIGDDA